MPIVKFNPIQPFASNQLSPFNAQNVFLHRDVIPYYMNIPFIGRMDDIWGAYLLLKKFPNSIAYTKASVYQQRNQHNYIKDMELEMIGYKHTLDFLNNKFNLPENSKKAYNLYTEHFQNIISKTKLLETEEVALT